MMGERTVMQEALFYSFSIEDHVPTDHLPRSIDRFVELDGIREHLKPYYSEIGRPSIDPELMIRMLIVGYCMGIRSERRLCEEVHLNLAYRWFCRLDLEAAVPDHSTFSKNRHGRFRDSDLLRPLFEMTVERCMAEGLVGGEGFAVDASLIRADVHRQRSVPGVDGLPPEAVGRPLAFHLTVGEAADCKAYDTLIGLPERAPRALLADKGYDADAIRTDLANRNIQAVIPGRLNRRVKIEYDRALYKQRNHIERFFGRLKINRAIATPL